MYILYYSAITVKHIFIQCILHSYTCYYTLEAIEVASHKS